MKQSLTNIAVFIGIILSISGCQPHDKQPLESKPLDTIAIKTAIASVGATVQKAHDTKDYKLLGTTWAKDGILSIAGSPPVRGRDAIVSAFSTMPPPPPGGKMAMNPFEIKVLSEDWAYVLGVDSLTYTPAGSKELIKDTFTFFVLVKKTDEGWQTYREILSPNQLPKNESKK